MNNSDVAEIRTVGEMIKYLQHFPPERLILKYEMADNGYKLFERALIEYFIVRPNPDPSHTCPYVDAMKVPGGSETECALVL